uniref:G-protein coupled receptors family 1 profile domain-containing protein n=1 Tax=Plectus sambesii TaxID=2011161 RepID=A0A914USB1_9BILA
MVVLVMPVVAANKITQILDCGIAIDRLTAIQWPISYQSRSRFRYTAAFLALGILLATFNVTYALTTTEIKQRPGCAVAGCFLSSSFNIVSGYVNLVIDPVVLITTLLVLYKVYTLKTSRISQRNEASEMFKRANRATVGVMLCSIVTMLVPSVLQSVGKVFGFDLYQQVGPVSALTLILNAAANPFIYGFRHSDIRAAVKTFRQRNTSIVIDVRVTTDAAPKSGENH